MTARKDFRDRFGKDITEFESFRRAVETVKSSTRNHYISALTKFFTWLDQDPDSVIKQRREDILSSDFEVTERYDRKVIAYANYLLTEKHQTGRSVNGTIGRIQGFFSNNSKRYSLDLSKLKLPKARKQPKYSPSNSEVKRLYTCAESYRDKIIVGFAYQNGLTPIDIASLKDDVPAKEWSIYERSRSKTGEVWYGVVTPDLSYDLKRLLESRGGAKGEPLFQGRQGPLDSKAVSEVLTNLVSKAGFSFKPTALRDAFEDALVEANVPPKIKEALMGHVSGIEMEYGGENNKQAHLVNAMKQAYPFFALNGLSRLMGEDSTLRQHVDELEGEIARLNDLVKNTLGSLCEWASTQGFQVPEDFEMVRRVKKLK